MDTRIKAVHKRHDRGFNCAQAVSCAYADCVGVEEELVFRATEGLGLGMGCMDGTCGALTGAIVLAGLANSSANLAAPSSKAATYELVARMCARFRERCGSLVCRELRGEDSGTPLMPCSDCITEGAMIVEEMLLENA